jgi:hypothetical protein
MTKANNMKEELLKQVDDGSAGASDAKPDSAQRIIETYKAQVRWLRWVTVASWVVTILYFATMSILRDILGVDITHFLTEEELLIRYSDIGLKVLLVIAVFLTVAVYLKSRTLTIQQICARLANIEEQLKKMSQDK